MLILLKQSGLTTTKTRLFWDTATKSTSSDTVTSSVTYVRGGGTLAGNDMLIDSYESGSNLIWVIWRNTFTTPLLFTFGNTKLLAFKNDPTGEVKYITQFDLPSKTSATFERYHGDNGIASYKAFDNNYIRATLDTLATQCIGVNATTWVSDGTGGVNKAITYNSVACGFVVPTAGTVVTESIVIKLDNECKDNPIYLRWLNTLGGFDSFMFYFSNEKNIQTSSLGVFQRPYRSLSEKDYNYTRGKRLSNSLLLGVDGLSQNDYEGIFPDLFASPAINIVDTSGNETPVKILDGSWKMNSRDKVHSIEFEIELPQYFTITR
jgi:hypothetical protein